MTPIKKNETVTLPVWDYLRDDWSGVFEVGPHGIRPVSQATTTPVARDAAIRDNATTGTRQGFFCTGYRAVWMFDDANFCIWTRDREIAYSDKGALIVGELRVLREEVNEVLSFINPDDHGHRGVKLKMKTGDVFTIVEEHDEMAELEPTYNYNDALNDGFWTRFLGVDLAKWFGVGHRGW
jgi:hypothetical protein